MRARPRGQSGRCGKPAPRRIKAAYLEGGIAAWKEAGLATRKKLGAIEDKWVTREHPKIDRIACPWLISRFINPLAEFLYVPADDVVAVAKKEGATPYDINGAEFGHAGDRCSFDAIIRIFEINDPALDHLADIVRGADTSRPDLMPQCEGLLAISYGLSATIPTTTRCSGTAWSSTTRSIAGAAASKHSSCPEEIMSRLVGCNTLAAVAVLCLAMTNAGAQTITFENDTAGQPPKNFEFGLAGDGGPGRWQIVADKTAGGGKALAQLSTDTAANRFLVAIYNPIVFANGEITTRCRPMRGKVDQACGVIVRATDARNYYIARANALEDNVRFYRVRNGERQELATADNIKVASGQWHTLTLNVTDNRYTVVFNGKTLHATTDTTAEPRAAEGRAGLWVKSDSVTHFDRIEIQQIP